jgi:hypothetical protein
MNIGNVFKNIAIVLTVIEFVLTIVYVVMTLIDINEEVVTGDQSVMAEVITVEPHEVVNTLNNESILTPIEECDNNPRACRWARGERKELSVLRYTKSAKNLTSGRSAILATIEDVRNMLTLVPNDDRVSMLVYRTFTHESLLGTIDFTNANGQGIGQLTLKHAKDILKRLSRRSPENFAIIAEISEIKNLLTLSDKELLKELHTNLKLQVALCITTYWFKDPMFWQKAGSLEADAKLWKQLYNTELGKGTVEAFIASCKAHI